jgi:hypothetical protein
MIYARIHNYSVSIDAVIIFANVFVHLSYLGLTTMVEYCTLVDRNTGELKSAICTTILSNNLVVKWYTSTGLVLAFWGFIIDFIMGTLLVIAISTVQSIKRALDNLSHRYRNRAYMAFAAWTFLLFSVIALAVLHALLPSIYNTIHINSIVNLLVEVLNTLQVYKFLNNLVCRCL